MIAITAYTEPIPVNIVESPQIQENEEPSKSDEQSGFAAILARLLQNPEAPIEVNDLAGVEEVVVPITGEELIVNNENPLFSFTEKPQSENSAENFFAPMQELSQENIGTLLDTEIPEIKSAENFDEMSFQNKITDLINSEHLPETELESDFFTIDAFKKEAASQMAAKAAASNEEVLKAQAGGRREREPFKIENIEFFNEDVASLKNRPETDKPGKLDELRNSKSRRDKFTIEVRDQRTAAETQNVQSAQTQTIKVVEASAARVQGESGAREITLELRLPEQNNPAAQTQTIEAKATSAFESLLARELHNNFNGDIVRHASIALRDGGEGTIKIALKPESLGNVKIALELAENKITGKIIVESEEAMNAFRKEIASLEQLFRDSGFSGAELNLSMAAEGQNAKNWDMDTSSFIPRMIADSYEESFEYDAFKLIDVFTNQKLGSINMLA